MSRLYDPHNPRMLTREEVARLNPVECAAACEELDQNILSTLQSIDVNFADTTRIVTDVLIPIVEKYGSSSKHVWDSVKLWKAFFEASAGVSSGPGGVDDEEYEGEEADGDTTAREHEHEQEQQDYNDYTEEGNSTATLEPVKPKKSKSHKSKRVSTTPPSSSSSSEDDDHDGDETEQQEHEFIVPPRKAGGRGVEPSWAEDTSPFEQLRQDIQKVRIDASYSTSSSYRAPPFAPSSIAAKKQQQHQVQEEKTKKQQQQQQTRLRDLSMDSPDFERPALQTMSFQHPRERLTQQYVQAPLHDAQDKGKGRAYQVYPDEEDSVDSSSAVPDTPAGISTLSNLSSLGGPSGGDTRPGMPHRKSSGTNNQNALLQKVLMKNLVGKDGRPNLSTPATKRMSKSIDKARKSQVGQLGDDQEDEQDVPFYPKDLPSDWNGLADLSKAPLSAFESPQKKSSSHAFGSQRSASRNRTAYPSASKPGLPSSISSDSLFDNSIFRDESGIPVASGSTNNDRYQPPVFSAYKSRLSRTPAKEAARLITRDVLQKASLRDGGDWEDAGMDSPALDPPSVVKNWATRGYTTHFPPPGSAQKLPTGAIGSAKQDQSQQRSQLLVPLAEGDDSFEAEFDDEEAGLPPPPPQPNFGHLADEGDERAQEGGGIVMGESSGNGDDWGDSFEGRSGEDDDDNSGFDEPAQMPLNDEQGGAEEGDSFSDNSRSLDDETVFGAKRGRVSNDPNQLGYGLHPSEAPDPNSRQAHLFRLQAQNDMVTLHGGNLLESQPFEASPLAGRDARYGL